MFLLAHNKRICIIKSVENTMEQKLELKYQNKTHNDVTSWNEHNKTTKNRVNAVGIQHIWNLDVETENTGW